MGFVEHLHDPIESPRVVPSHLFSDFAVQHVGSRDLLPHVLSHGLRKGRVIEQVLHPLHDARVEKWRVYDEKGEALGFPAYVEADVLVRDNVHVLIEVKASVSEGDVVKFWRIGRLYERLVGVKPELVIVSPFVDEKSIETAKRLNVRVYTGT